MKRTSTFALLVAGTLGIALFSALPVRNSVAQGPDRPPAVPGRYQVALGGGTPAPCVVIDSTTGQCWLKSATGWEDLGSPIAAKK